MIFLVCTTLIGMVGCLEVDHQSKNKEKTKDEVKVGEMVEGRFEITYPERDLKRGFLIQYRDMGFYTVKIDSFAIYNIHTNYYLGCFAIYEIEDTKIGNDLYLPLRQSDKDLYYHRKDSILHNCIGNPCNKCEFDIDRCLCVGSGDNCNHNIKNLPKGKNGLTNVLRDQPNRS